MRCLVPAPAFAAMYSDAALSQFNPWLVKLFEPLLSELLAVDCSWPNWSRATLRVFIRPGRFVMRNIVRKIAAAALRNVEVFEFGSHLVSDLVAVSDDD